MTTVNARTPERAVCAPREEVPPRPVADPVSLAWKLRLSIASTARRRSVLHWIPMSGAIWWLPVLGCAAMMGGCAWMMWRMHRRTPEAGRLTGRGLL
jgi:hypothetical protein